MANFYLIFLTLLSLTFATDLEVVQDNELLHLLKLENVLIVLFAYTGSKYSEGCDKNLTSVRTDLIDLLDARVVRVNNTKLPMHYAYTASSLVYYRYGAPMSIYCRSNGTVILDSILQKSHLSVKELTDLTFEDLTQVVSGSNGDWLIFFSTNNCMVCQRLQNVLEAVAGVLQNRVNVARVNPNVRGVATGRRFSVLHVPAFILFREGKMYRYPLKKYDLYSLVSFAKKGYKNVTSAKVPAIKTPQDDLVALTAHYATKRRWQLKNKKRVPKSWQNKSYYSVQLV